MSNQALGWVDRYSPFKGNTFNVHRSIADTVSDVKGNEFWMAIAKLARKSHCSRQAASMAVAEIEAAGLIVPLGKRSKGGRATRWRFVMPAGMAMVYDPLTITGEPGTRTVASVDGSPDEAEIGSIAAGQSPAPEAGQGTVNLLDGSEQTVKDGDRTVVHGDTTVNDGDGHGTQETQTTQAAGARTRARGLNAVWDAFVDWTRKEGPADPRARGAWNRAEAGIRKDLGYVVGQGGEPEYRRVRVEIRRRAQAFARKYPWKAATPINLWMAWWEFGPDVEAPPIPGEYDEPHVDIAPAVRQGGCEIDAGHEAGCTVEHGGFVPAWLAHPDLLAEQPEAVRRFVSRRAPKAASA